MVVLYENPHVIGSVEVAQSGRSLTDRIRNPSPTGLLVALLFSIVPLALPLLLYMVLRYVTGHRAPRADGQPHGPSVLSSLGRKMRYPSGVGLVVGWVIAVCTYVGNPFAIYMTWRFAKGYRATDPPA